MTTLMQEFHNGLLAMGAKPDEIDGMDLEKAFQYFDRDQNGRVTIEELVRGLRVHALERDLCCIYIYIHLFMYTSFLISRVYPQGRIPKRRVLLIRQAFDILDVSKDGTVSIDEIKNRFDTTHHPDVLSGQKTPQEVYAQFLSVRLCV